MKGLEAACGGLERERSEAIRLAEGLKERLKAADDTATAIRQENQQKQSDNAQVTPPPSERSSRSTRQGDLSVQLVAVSSRPLGVRLLIAHSRVPKDTNGFKAGFVGDFCGLTCDFSCLKAGKREVVCAFHGLCDDGSLPVGEDT